MWRANDDDESLPIPVVCERESSSPDAAAAAAVSPSSSGASVERQPALLDVNVTSRHERHSDVMASTDLTCTPEHLRHCSSWPEDALAEHLTDMRSC